MRRHRRLVQAAVTPRREDMRQPGNCATERGTLGRRHRRQGSAAALRVTEHVLLREKARLVRGVHWSPASRAHAGRTVPPLVTGPADRRDPALECAPRLALRNAYEAHGARHFASPKHGVPSARRPACRSWWRARACCSSPSPSSCGGPANGNPPRHPRLRARGRRRDGGSQARTWSSRLSRSWRIRARWSRCRLRATSRQPRRSPGARRRWAPLARRSGGVVPDRAGRQHRTWQATLRSSTTEKSEVAIGS
jgi:hypothetical protein